MSDIERWTAINRRDWDNGPSIIPAGAWVPTPAGELEVFEVVRASDYEGAVDRMREVVDALRAIVKLEGAPGFAGDRMHIALTTANRALDALEGR